MIPLLCPVCKGELTLSGSSYVCPSRHCFDIAKEGYVNLALGKSDSGDSSDMCRARHEFLKAGYYRPLADKIADVLCENGSKSICDAGCGEGYYDRMIKSRIPDADVVALDLAKTSVRLGAREEKCSSAPIRYAVAGIFSMPLPDCSFDALLSVFAPIPEAEARRILKDSGTVLVVHPGKEHLSGLKNLLYEIPYDNEESTAKLDGFTHRRDERVRYTVSVAPEHVHSLFLMTPYYWKTSREDARKLDSGEPLTTVLDFIISVYEKN